MSRYRNMGRAHLLSTADLVNPSACPGSRVDGFRCALPILRLGLWIRGNKNAGAFAPASSCIFRWNAGSARERSEESRAGKKGVSRSECRGAPCDYKKKKK